MIPKQNDMQEQQRIMQFKKIFDNMSKSEKESFGLALRESQRKEEKIFFKVLRKVKLNGLIELYSQGKICLHSLRSRKNQEFIYETERYASFEGGVKQPEEDIKNNLFVRINYGIFGKTYWVHKDLLDLMGYRYDTSS